MNHGVYLKRAYVPLFVFRSASRIFRPRINTAIGKQARCIQRSHQSRVGLENPPIVPHALYLPTTLRSLKTMLFSGKLFAAFLAVTASRVTGSHVELANRAGITTGNVSFCVGIAGVKPCLSHQILVEPLGYQGICYPFPSPFNKKVGSFTFDNGLTCYLYP